MADDACSNLVCGAQLRPASKGVKIRSIPDDGKAGLDWSMSGILEIEQSLVAQAAWLPMPDEQQVLVSDPVTFPVSLRRIRPDLTLEIGFPEFGGAFGGPITVDDSKIDFGVVTATARITPNLDLEMKLVGDSEDRTASSTEATVEIRHRDSERRRALDVFVTYTLFALLGLSRRVDLQLHIPGIEPLVSLRFDIPLGELSQFLRSRQIAYKVMVIEQATHERFDSPVTRSAIEVSTISFIYEAIVKRSFLWPDNYDGGLIRLPASTERLNELLALRQGTDLKFPPHPLSRTLFGKPISLGVGTLTILDAVIEDEDKLKAMIERGDGCEVQVRIRSLSGRIRYDLPEAPQIAEEQWDPNTRALIDIEQRLDAALVERYHTLAAATLAGLTEEEKAQVTARVDFGTAFLTKETNGDNGLWQRLLRFLKFH